MRVGQSGIMAEETKLLLRNTRYWCPANPLMKAIFDADEKQVLSQLKSGADPNLISDIEYQVGRNKKSVWKTCPLHLAVTEQKYKIIEILLDNGADTECTGKPLPISLKFKGNTPLFQALRSSPFPIPIFKLLLEKGSDPNVQDLQGETIFMHACQTKEVPKECLDMILQRSNISLKDHKGRTALHHVLLGLHARNPDIPLTVDGQHYCVKLLKDLVKMGADINVLDVNNETLLHYAVRLKCPGAIKFLIEHSKHFHEKHENPFLHCLCDWVIREWGDAINWDAEADRFMECLFLLLAEGRSVHERNKTNQTVLHKVVENKWPSQGRLVSCLLEAGADANAQDTYGCIPLYNFVDHVAHTNLNEEESTTAFQLLMKHTTDINTQNAKGDTPLHIAISTDNIQHARVLIENGADLMLANNLGITPLHQAMTTIKGVDLLREKIEPTMDLTVQDVHGSTPCHWAACHPYAQKHLDHMLGFMAGKEIPSDSKGRSYKDIIKLWGLETLNLPPFEGIDTQNDAEWFEEIDKLFHNSENSFTFPPGFLARAFHKKYMGLMIDTPENETIAQACLSVVRTATENVSSQNCLFKTELILAGSTTEGTKAVLPNELDILCVFRNLERCFGPVIDNIAVPGTVRMLKKETMDDPHMETLLEKFTFSNGSLDPRGFANAFYRALSKELIHVIRHHDNLRLLKNTDSKKGSIDHIVIQYNGHTYYHLKVSIDIVCALEFPDLNPDHLVRTGRRLHIDAINKIPLQVVIRTIHNPNFRYTDIYHTNCRMSVARRENAAMKALPEVCRKAYAAAKTLVHRSPYSITPSGNEKSLTSYMIKNALFYAVDQVLVENDAYLDTVDMSILSKGDACNTSARLWLYRIGRQLYKYASVMHQPVYFLRGIDLFDGLTDTKKPSSACLKSSVDRLCYMLLKIKFFSYKHYVLSMFKHRHGIPKETIELPDVEALWEKEEVQRLLRQYQYPRVIARQGAHLYLFHL